LIQQPPAKYIRTIRLQKAKEWLETTDITVGEAAFKTGFQRRVILARRLVRCLVFCHPLSGEKIILQQKNKSLQHIC
jgi:AraC-like DNA-binding protein